MLYEKQNDFLNGLFHIQTPYKISEIEKRLKIIEAKLGRKRTKNKNGPRTIDLDIVVFNNQIIDDDVFKRDFLKNLIVDLFPEFYEVLNCKNYMDNFNHIKQVIEIVKSELPQKPISIFGAGNWFSNEDSIATNIDIMENAY